jgi:hypothetical protein
LQFLQASTLEQATPTGLMHFMGLQALKKAVRYKKGMSHQYFAA